MKSQLCPIQWESAQATTKINARNQTTRQKIITQIEEKQRKKLKKVIFLKLFPLRK